MTTMDVGDRVNVQYLAFAAGVASTATVALTVTAPDGATTTPTVTLTSPNIYNASFTLTAAGTWSWVWNVSGLVVDVEYGSVYAANPGPPIYATLTELRSRLGASSSAPTTEDGRLTDALQAASRGIDKQCGRSFGAATTATARLYYPEPDRHGRVTVDDFYTTTDLVIETSGNSDGTFDSTWTTAEYELQPLNGIVDGEEGWPYYRILAINRCWPWPRWGSSWHSPWSPGSSGSASLRVTARWGWRAVPANVHEGCLILAEEIYTLSKTPFGVGGYGQFGIIRARQNPMVAARIGPYVRSPILVG